jgi:hypothetical protein
MKKINYKEFDKTNNIEEQISSMLEKVLVDDDTDTLSVTDYTNKSDTSMFSQKRRGSNMSEGLFNFSRKAKNIPNDNLMDGFIRNETKKPNTVSYSTNTNYYFNILQQRNNSYMMNMRPQGMDYNFCPK